MFCLVATIFLRTSKYFHNPSFKNPHFQNEVKCANEFYLHENEPRFEHLARCHVTNKSTYPVHLARFGLLH